MTIQNTFKQSVKDTINAKHLLKHPFYIAWTEGKLTKEQLRHYAEQYFYNVLAEPTYLSAVHFNTPHFSTAANSVSGLVGLARKSSIPAAMQSTRSSS